MRLIVVFLFYVSISPLNDDKIYNPQNDQTLPNRPLVNTGIVFSRVVFCLLKVMTSLQNPEKIEIWSSPGKTSLTFVVQSQNCSHAEGSVYMFPVW